MDLQGGDGFGCRICECRNAASIHEVSSTRHLATRFQYVECEQCGSLSLAALPNDLAAYYQDGYYSFANGIGWFKKHLRAERDATYFARGNALGHFLARQFWDDGALPPVSKLNMELEAKILDVGCGSGRLLRRMAAIGFKNLWGVDPFVREDINDGGSVRIRRCRIEDLKGEKYDLIMFHHSLEHVTEPKDVLQSALQLLALGGRCLVRLPIVAYAWEKYRTNWVQLDPPRHVWLPTEHGMRQLVASAGLKVDAVEYDSTEFQFWGSELCQRGAWFGVIHPSKVRNKFARQEWQTFCRNAKELNRQGEGDQACFYLSSNN